MGKFIIASNNRGNKDVLAAYSHAYIYEQNTIHSLRVAMQDVQHNYFAISDFKMCEDQDTFEETARRYLSLYKNLIIEHFDRNTSEISVNVEA
jgi:hypothetical protein